MNEFELIAMLQGKWQSVDKEIIIGNEIHYDNPVNTERTFSLKYNPNFDKWMITAPAMWLVNYITKLTSTELQVMEFWTYEAESNLVLDIEGGMPMNPSRIFDFVKL